VHSGYYYDYWNFYQLSDHILELLSTEFEPNEDTAEIRSAVQAVLKTRKDFRSSLSSRDLLLALIRNRIRCAFESEIQGILHEGGYAYGVAKKFGCLPEIIPVLQGFWSKKREGESIESKQKLILAGSNYADRII